MTSDEAFLDQARNLTQQQFRGVNFKPTNVIVITWVNVRQAFANGSDVSGSDVSLPNNVNGLHGFSVAACSYIKQ